MGEEVNDRDYFAAAALTGLLCSNGHYGSDHMPERALQLADSMLRERDAAEPLIKENTAAASEQKPVAWAADIPGKFGAAPTMLFGYTEKLVKGIAAAGGDLVEPFPLYRTPQTRAAPSDGSVQGEGTLTDAEREAVEQAIDASDGMVPAEPWAIATLRGLLERIAILENGTSARNGAAPDVYQK